jgi:hypothetical protein
MTGTMIAEDRRYGESDMEGSDLEDKKVNDRDNDGRGQEIWRTVTWRKGT